MTRPTSEKSTPPKTDSVIDRLSQSIYYTCDLSQVDLIDLFHAIERDQRKEYRRLFIIQQRSKHHLFFGKGHYKGSPPFYGEMKYEAGQLSIILRYESRIAYFNIVWPWILVLFFAIGSAFNHSDVSKLFEWFIWFPVCAVGLFFIWFYIHSMKPDIALAISKDLQGRGIVFEAGSEKEVGTGTSI